MAALARPRADLRDARVQGLAAGFRGALQMIERAQPAAAKRRRRALFAAALRE